MNTEMLSSLLYNMEGSSNNLNNNTPPGYSLGFDESVILNCVRNRKKNSELPNCPACSCTIRQGELESHLSLELEKLIKLTSGSSKRKLSANSSGSNNSSFIAMPGSSAEVIEDEVDVSGGTGSDVYQRVHTNRLRRLRTRTRRTSPVPQSGECPVCNVKFPVSRLQRHALRCLRRTGAQVDDDVPDTSSEEEGSIDVENDEPVGAGGSFGAEYQWCGEWRVRATALQASEGSIGTPVRRVSNDTALVVDGDEDMELYGPPQYSPSRIAPDADISISTPSETVGRTDNTNSVEQETAELNDVQPLRKTNGLVEASAETRIQALKAKIKELEMRQVSGSDAKCLICLGAYVSPAVSIQCWHVYCEVCWLESLRAKKICPQCNAITTAEHLRRIYM